MILIVYALHLLASIFVYFIAIFECTLFETMQLCSIGDERFFKTSLKECIPLIDGFQHFALTIPLFDCYGDVKGFEMSSFTQNS